MNNTQLHIVLGGSGAIGNAVLQELKSRNVNTKTVERNKEVNGFETIKADLLNKEEIVKVLEGASYVYLCVGLPYNSAIWARDWPIVMENVIEACSKNNAKLVFFDNVYMYGPTPLKTHFDETHSQIPQTVKGKARKMTTDFLLTAIRQNRVKGVIGRSADFYGPHAINSPFYISFLERMLRGKSPQLLSGLNIKHTYAYTKDNAKALVTLALDESSYGEVWHLPVGEPIEIHYVLNIFNKELSTNYTASVAPKFMQKTLALFVKPIKEMQEMLYQFDYPYIMSSSKFMNKYPEFKVTAYEDGLKEMVKSFKNR